MPKIYILESDQNLRNVIAVKHFINYDVILLKNPNLIANYMQNGLLDYLKRINRVVEQQIFDPHSHEQIEKLAQRLDSEDIVVIPCGEYAYAHNMSSLLKDKCKRCYVEEFGDIFIDINSFLTEQRIGRVDLNVEAFIDSFGESVSDTSLPFFTEPTASRIFDLIAENLEDYQSMMRPIPIKSHMYDKNRVFIDLSIFDKKPRSKVLLDKILSEMYVAGKCDLKMKANQYEAYFHDKNYKDFLTKTGTWLEALTYKVLSGIDVSDSPLSGLKFYWKTDDGKVINEIDVMGIHGKELILISCKDTGELTESALSELVTYGENLGFETIKRILVSTSTPQKSLARRAANLGIHIVVYKKSEDTLRTELQSILL